MTRKPKLLGIAASLRNARWGAGNRNLIAELKELADEQALGTFLETQSELHLKNFLDAGRSEGKSFDEIYRNLRKSGGSIGLSNSETALAAGLWGAHRKGVEIDHLSLAEFFTVNGELRHPEQLRAALMDADGILVSGPVYFGDRGSLAESLFDFIRSDEDLRAAMKGRLYGGIAVGAKRNGGQETTLIYQMMDMVDLGMVAVGNDSDTTSQYGGTCHAGDVGTAYKDSYGIGTSIGTGRRMASVLNILTSRERLADAPRALFLVLQDAGGVAREAVEKLVQSLGPLVDATIVDVSSKHVKRCLACDICPTHIDVDESYRCIIKSGRDDFPEMHQDLLYHDMIVPVVLSGAPGGGYASNYQTFVERSRYIRRGDYVWSDLVVSPISISPPRGHDSYLLRMMTSFLRHHTIMTRPLIGDLGKDGVGNIAELSAEMKDLLPLVRRITAGRLATARADRLQYRPVGYVLSAHKDMEDEKLRRREMMIEDRLHRLQSEGNMRLLGRVVDG